jgi:hypothetical protein
MFSHCYVKHFSTSLNENTFPSLFSSLFFLIPDYSLGSVKWKNQNKVKRSADCDMRSDSSEGEGGTEDEGDSKSEGEGEGD